MKRDFPLLQQLMNGKPLIYLDSAATTQKPQQVLDAMHRYYTSQNANVHRGVYALAATATDLYEGAREKAARFLNASSPREIVFTRGTTEALNLVAAGWLRPRLQPGDEILTTVAEHHSNLIPWQMAAKAAGARLRFFPLEADGTLDLAKAAGCITPRTRAIAIAHISNVLGTIHPLQELAALAHRQGAVLIVDAAQSAAHHPLDVQQLDCDFLAFSGHKLYGPTGIGVLYGKSGLLADTEPVQYGGEMIDEVELFDASWKDAPWKLEAGTPPIAEAAGLAAAIDYLEVIGRDNIKRQIESLAAYACDQLSALDGITLYGPQKRGGVAAFNLDGAHPHDVATVLDAAGIAVRAGHHCAQPLMRWLGAAATVRASFGIYNTRADVDALTAALREAKGWLGK
ncbi:cysteine desulfurase/selenocysteine lyase [Tumebacillus sp. BK434]|uniref:cysteine desulfurase n=1 Tax=Tumebacillus sp. BK434 TaxID=2512169 RepID=UPI0010512C3C|nr:cysteine desulfurase [Tumebacillus sp. BK434]TCP55680.1 cysteine desulfurase/selenocysteine lyase [Tumebacillus sp. BK434]